MAKLPAQLPIEPLAGPFDLVIDDLPGSKSLTNRALLLAALAEGESTLTNVLFSDDSRVMLDALAKLGFKIKQMGLLRRCWRWLLKKMGFKLKPSRTVTVHGGGGKIPNKEADLFLGNAGTAMRFLTAACCLGEPGSTYTLRGIPRMHERPIGELVDALRELGATIEYLGEEGYPPLKVHGGIKGGSLTMKPTISSQYISALLQIGPYLAGGLTLNFDGKVTSWPYVRMTSAIMTDFGAGIHGDKNPKKHLRVQGGKRYKSRLYSIEPDASNTSYFLAAVSIVPGSSLTIQGLSSSSVQGDAGFIGVLAGMRAGTGYTQGDTGISIKSPDPLQLRGIDVDLNDMPDMAQTLAVVALFADGPTTIRNVGNLRVKETDRMAALEKELTKLGAKVTISDEGEGNDITIVPPLGNVLRHRDDTPISKEKPVVIDTYDDHRMAMAFAVAGLRSPGIVIDDPACVNKTFPDYFEYLERLRQDAK